MRCVYPDAVSQKMREKFSLWSQHVFGLDPLVELLFRQEPEGDGLLLERRAVLVGRLGDLGSLVVANVGVQGSHQHQGLVQELIHSVTVHSDSVLKSKTKSTRDWIRSLQSIQGYQDV